MKEIPLSQSKQAIVDDADYEWLNQWKWHYHSGGYAARTAKINGEKKNILMHRLLLPDSEQIDHIDRNGLNNCHANLRSANQATNKYNRGKSHNKSCKYKGVSLNKKTNKWEAHITLDYKKKHIGLFLTPRRCRVAALAYNFMAAQYFGEFACFNKVA